MFFHTRIKWTIDAEHSEIFFRVRHLTLASVHNATKKMENDWNADEFNSNKCYSNSIPDNGMYKDNGGDKRRSRKQVKSKQL